MKYETNSLIIDVILFYFIVEKAKPTQSLDTKEAFKDAN